MAEIKLGMVEARFADIVWQHAPLSTKELVALCEEELNWKRTTTYTVLKKLCERGIFEMENSRVTVLIGKDEFYAIQSEKFVRKPLKGRYRHLLRHSVPERNRPQRNWQRFVKFWIPLGRVEYGEGVY